MSHPQRDRLLSSRPDIPTINLAAGPQDQDIQRFRQLTHFDSSRAVGVVAGPAEYTFGTIVDALVMSRGRIATIDRDYGIVRLFDDDLKTVGTFGGFGGGPGEFLEPVALAETSDSSLVVVDIASGRLQVNRFASTDSIFGYEYLDRNRLPIYAATSATDVCSMSGRTFVNGVLFGGESFDAGDLILASPSVVHEISNGSVINSFSEPYPLPFERRSLPNQSLDEEGIKHSRAIDFDVMSHFASARLVCSPFGSDDIWIAYSNLGEVHLNTPDGELQWIARLTDFVAPDLQQRVYSYGTSLGGSPEATFPIVRDHISDLSLVARDVLAMQITRTTTQRDRSRSFEYFTYLMDAGNGGLIDKFTASHRVMTAQPGRAVLYREGPHPQILLAPSGGEDD